MSKYTISANFEPSEEFVAFLDKINSDLMFLWVWDDEDKVYKDDETGKEMNEETMIALRDQIVDWQVDYFAKWPVEEDEKPKDKDHPNILALLLLGIIGLGLWEERMRDSIQDVFVIEYVFGHGGFDRMTIADWEILDELLLIQYAFLSGFSLDISNGLLSEAEIAYRSGLYYSSAISSFERGRMAAQHIDLYLTRFPGDCSSQCCANDRCYWHYGHSKDTIECKWIRTAKESCPTCIARSRCPAVEFIKDTGEHINMECYESADA